MPATPANIAVTIFELGLLLAGILILVVYLFRHGLGPACRDGTQQRAGLQPWDVSFSDFLLFAFLIIAGGLFSAFLCGLIVGGLKLPTDTKTILNSAAFQLGLLLVPMTLPLNLTPVPFRRLLNQAALSSGAVTFLIALPLVTLVNFGWQQLLERWGIPAGQQDLLRMFTQTTQPVLIAVMVLLATVVAPIAEEMLFRATLFRYLRSRIPRWIAILLPGTIFAALHVNWSTLDGLASLAPLITLAVVFSLAYERTGRISTAIVAHGLFNLHTIILLLMGVTS